MATNKTTKTMTSKEPAVKATQTTLKVETEAKKPEVEVKADTKKTETVEKKAPAKKPAAKKTTAKKTTAKKTTAKKTTTKKEVTVKAEVFVQCNGLEYSEKDIMEKVVAAWEAEDKKVSAIKRTKLYIKPEDGKAYYVINEGLKNGSTGAVEL